jgi:catechol 2,3-dioxygenase-like lactoylglutathione lyase family enzyme
MVSLQPAIPILRIFDETRARQFYVDWLGFTVDWEHRFHDGAPLYMQVSRDGLVLHLSEHSGDGTPGTAVFVRASGVAEWQRELIAKPYPYLRPGLDEGHDGGPALNLLDPFGNVLRVEEPADQPSP